MNLFIAALTARLGSAKPSAASSGWVQFNCPFCPGEDHEAHFGVNLERTARGASDPGVYKCFRCETRGTLRNLFWRLRLPWPDRDAPAPAVGFAAIDDLLAQTNVPVRNERVDYALTDEDWTPGVAPFSAEAYYLYTRGLGPEEIRRYRIGSGAGRLSRRVVFPEFDGDRIIFYQARSIVNARDKYLSPSGRRDWHIWNFSNVRSRVVIAEGILSAIACGPDAVALYSYGWLPSQAEMLAAADFEEYVIAFDGEPKALEQAHGLAQALISRGIGQDRVRVAVLPYKKDPADLGRDRMSGVIAAAPAFRPEALFNQLEGLLNATM